MSDVSDEVDVRRCVAYALAVFPGEVVSRSTVRALLPETGHKMRGARQHLTRMRKAGGDTPKSRTSIRFQKALWRFEQDGLIQRGEEFILVRNKRELMERATDGLSVSALSHPRFLRLQAAAEAIEAQLAEENRPKVLAARQAELRFIRELMRGPVRGSMRSGSKAVRFVPPSKPL